VYKKQRHSDVGHGKKVMLRRKKECNKNKIKVKGKLLLLWLVILGRWKSRNKTIL